MTNPDYTHFSLIVDRSGSMQSIRVDMEGGIEELLTTQRSLPGKLLVDVTTFDSQIETPVIASADVTSVSILPRGMTALLDALGSAVTGLGERLAALPEDERPGKVLVAVVTDGIENASRDWTPQQVNDLVTQQREQYDWDFVFLGANIDSFAVAGGLGFSKGSTLNYAATSRGAANATRSLSSYVTGYRTAGAASFEDIDTDSDTTV